MSQMQADGVYNGEVRGSRLTRQPLGKRGDDENAPEVNPTHGRSALVDVTNADSQDASQHDDGSKARAAKPRQRSKAPHTKVLQEQPSKRPNGPVQATGMEVDPAPPPSLHLLKNIDELDDARPLACAHIAEEIMSNLFQTERVKWSVRNYIDTGIQDITPPMRAILIDWLVEVSQEYKLVTETLYLTVDYVDRYLSKVPTPREELQLVGVTCMLLAAKYEEIYPPTVQEFCFITENTYNRDEVLRTERKALNALNFELTFPSTRVFLRRFIKAAAVSAPFEIPDKRLDLLSNYLAELTLIEYHALRFEPSRIAAAAVLLAQYCLADFRWNATLQYYARYTAPELRECVEFILKCWEAARSSELVSIREKYAQPHYGCISSMQPPGRVASALFR